MQKRLSKMKDKLNARDWLLVLAPPMMFMSYRPVIQFGVFSDMNVELSVALVYLAVLAVVNLREIWRARQKLVHNKAVLLVLVFGMWNLLSLMWTNNLMRAVLTAGVVWALIIVFLAVLVRKDWRELKEKFYLVLLAATAVFCVVGLYQFWAGLWLGSEATGLCAGCSAVQFGFVRPTGLAIEPQFFGSLLLLPILWLLHKTLQGKRKWWEYAFLGFFIIMMILTLSRGAIYALILGVILLVVLNYKKVKRVLLAAGIMLVGVAVALSMQGAAAVINPKIDDGFWPAVTRSIHQLSIGIIDLRPELPVQDAGEQPYFDGYVEESTDTRTSLSGLALETWGKNVQTMMFGVGLGGSGRAISEHTGKIDAMEIVQNEYMEVLLELGLVGLVLFAVILAGWVWGVRKNKWLWAVMLAYAAQWWFFSGYPNVLHIYLFMAISWAISRRKYEAN